LKEFCFRSKRAVRREQERRNLDMYSDQVHGPPRRGGRQDARARRVGGGQGDGGGYRPQFGFGSRVRGFGGGYDAPRFPRGGGRQPRGRRDLGTLYLILLTHL